MAWRFDSSIRHPRGSHEGSMYNLLNIESIRFATVSRERGETVTIIING